METNNFGSDQRKGKYVQKYKTEWEVGRPWLKQINDSAFCKVCGKQFDNNLTNLKRHENSKCHNKNGNEVHDRKSLLNVLEERNAHEDGSLNNEQLHTTEGKSIMDTEDIVVKTENCDSDEELLAEIRKELAKTRDIKAVTQENVDLSICIKNEEDSNQLSVNVETIGIDADATLTAENPPTVDSFIIYEINETNNSKNIVSQKVSDKTKSVEPTENSSKKLPNEIKISNWPFRYPLKPIVKRKRFEHKRQGTTPPSVNIPPPLLKILPTQTNAYKLKSSLKRRKQRFTAKRQATSIIEKDQSTSTKQSKPFLRNSPKIQNFVEISEAATTTATPILKNVKNVILLERYIAPPIKKITIPHKKPELASSSMFEICACHLVKGADVFTKLELKDFFERMFEETRKLSMERRQMVKMELLKAVCRAEEEVEAGRFCEKCYTVNA